MEDKAANIMAIPALVASLSRKRPVELAGAVDRLRQNTRNEEGEIPARTLAVTKYLVTGKAG